MCRVRWQKKARNELAQAWLQADSAERKAITAASHEIDQRLRKDPRNEGESRTKNRRIMFVQPLVVIFRVEKDGKTVSVLQIRLFRRGGA
jgi:hypothetical protein